MQETSQTTASRFINRVDCSTDPGQLQYGSRSETLTSNSASNGSTTSESEGSLKEEIRSPFDVVDRFAALSKLTPTSMHGLSWIESRKMVTRVAF